MSIIEPAIANKRKSYFQKNVFRRFVVWMTTRDDFVWFQHSNCKLQASLCSLGCKTFSPKFFGKMKNKFEFAIVFSSIKSASSNDFFGYLLNNSPMLISIFAGGCSKSNISGAFQTLKSQNPILANNPRALRYVLRMLF